MKKNNLLIGLTLIKSFSPVNETQLEIGVALANAFMRLIKLIRTLL